VHSLLAEFSISLVTSLLAAGLTAKQTKWLDNRPAYWHVGLILLYLGLVLLVLVLIDLTGNTVKNSPHSSEESSKTATAAPNANGNTPRQISKPAIEDSQQNFRRDTHVNAKRLANRWGILLRGSSGFVPHNLIGAALGAIRDRGYITAPPTCRPAVSNLNPQTDLSLLSPSSLRALEPVCDGFIAGDVKLKFTAETDPSLQGLITAIATIGVRIFSTTSASLVGEFELSGRGGGFSQEAATTQASDRLAVDLRTRLIRELP
jgi:hypothetical protein